MSNGGATGSSSVRCAQLAPILSQNVLYVYGFEQASHNGDLMHAVEAGAITREDVIQLGDVLAGTAEGRGHEDDITIFDSTGLAIQDLAIALAALERVDELKDIQTIEL